jgi:hypothetical protein
MKGSEREYYELYVERQRIRRIHIGFESSPPYILFVDLSHITLVWKFIL